MYIASQEGHLEVVKTLLDSGADAALHSENLGGMTPLQVATTAGHTEIVALLEAATR